MLRAFQHAGATRSFSQLELLNGANHRVPFGSRQSDVIVPWQQWFGSVLVEVFDPVVRSGGGIPSGDFHHTESIRDRLYVVKYFLLLFAGEPVCRARSPKLG